MSKSLYQIYGLISGSKKKSLITDTSTALPTDHELAMNRIEIILTSSDDHCEDDNIKSDDEFPVAATPDFHRSDDPFKKSLKQG